MKSCDAETPGFGVNICVSSDGTVLPIKLPSYNGDYGGDESIADGNGQGGKVPSERPPERALRVFPYV